MEMIELNISKTVIGGEEVNSSNLRELHLKIQSKQEFTNWAKKRLRDFVEGEDYLSFDTIVKREKGATVRKDYIITLDTAKHLSMMERNEQGMKIRRYFIHMEKEFRTNAPKTYIEALECLIENEKVLEAKKIELDQAKEWYSLKRAESIIGEPLRWQDLKSYSNANGIEIKKVFDQNYGHINAYHKTAYEGLFGKGVLC